MLGDVPSEPQIRKELLETTNQFDSLWLLVGWSGEIHGDTTHHPVEPRPPGPLTTSCGSVTETITTIRCPRGNGWAAGFLGLIYYQKRLKNTWRFQVSKWYFYEKIEESWANQNDSRDVHKEGFKAIEVEGGNSRLRWPGSNSLLYFLLHLVIYHFLFGVTFSFQLSTNSYRFQWLNSWFQMNSTQLPTRSSIDSSETSCCRRDGMLMLGLWALFQN